MIPKIADFGLSIQFETFDFSKSKCGTFLYMAPEILMNKLYSKVSSNHKFIASGCMGNRNNYVLIIVGFTSFL